MPKDVSAQPPISKEETIWGIVSWVDAGSRRRGVAHALAKAGADWGRARRLTHFGSHALLANEVSHAWHRAAGFAEVERLVVFAKRID